jgi:predicted nucleic acid-binding protein
MTHLLDTSALLAHYLGEEGAARVQEIFETDSARVGVSVLTLFEFELRLHQLGLDGDSRTEDVARYRNLCDEVTQVTEAVRAEAVRLRLVATGHIAAMNVLIAAAAATCHATLLVHRDPHFTHIPAALPDQEVLPAKGSGEEPRSGGR